MRKINYDKIKKKKKFRQKNVVCFFIICIGGIVKNKIFSLLKNNI